MSEPLNWLRSFEAAARRGTLTQAAMEVGLTQAAVSQQIKALESRLGIQLFQREPRGVSLTGAGTELYAEISKGLERIDSALERFVQAETSELYVLCNTSLANRWLLPRLPAFNTAYPDISLRFKTALWRTDLIGVNADVGIFLGEGGSSGDKITISDSEFVAVATPQYLIDQVRRYITVTGFEALTPTINDKQTTIEVDSFHAALCFAETGVGIAICPRLLAIDSLKVGQLIELEATVHFRKCTYQFSFMKMPNSTSSLFQEWLFDQLKE